MDNDQLKQQKVKILSTDYLEQSEAASDTFELWYEEAIKFAQSSRGLAEQQSLARATRQVMDVLLSEQVLLNIATDDLVIRQIMESFGKMLNAFSTKPKFTSCLGLDSFTDLRRWLSQNACTLISDAAFAQGVPDSKVRYLLGAFAKLLDVLLIAEVEAQQQGATERLLPACDALFSRLRHSLVHDAGAREEAEHVFQIISQHDERGKMATLLARDAEDSRAFKLCWEIGGLRSQEVIEEIRSRILAENSKGASSLSRDLARSLEIFLREHTGISVLEFGILELVEVCDIAGSAYKEETVGERATEVLDVLLERYPEHKRIMEICLRRPTLETLQLLTGHGSAFTVNEWLDNILPFAWNQIEAMDPQGVSGDQREQEVINIVRECARVFYLSREKMPTVSLAKTLFSTIVRAISRGYSETERFPSIAATILREHFDDAFDPSQAWMIEALHPSVASAHHKIRIVTEMCLRVLGDVVLLHNDVSIDRDLDMSRKERVIAVIAGCASPAAFAIAAGMLQDARQSLITTENIIGPFVRAAQRTVDDMVDVRVYDSLLAYYLVEFITKASTRCGPSSSLALFHVLLQISALRAELDKSNHIIPDDVLATLVEKIPIDETLSEAVVKQVFSICGPKARAAFAKYAPEQALRDIDANVRIAALTSLAMHSVHSDESVRVHSSAIIDSCSTLPRRVYGELVLEKNRLLVAAAPLLARVALLRPSPAMAASVQLLAEAALLTSETDSLKEAHSAVRVAIEEVFAGAERKPLMRAVVKLTENRAAVLLQALQDISPEAKRLTGKMLDSINKETIVHAGQQYLLHEDIILVEAEDDEINNLFSSYERAKSIGDMASCLRNAAYLRDNYREAYQRRGIQNDVLQFVLPYLDSHVLSAFPPEQSVFVLQEAMKLFPLECESVLQASKRMDGLLIQVMRSFVARGNPDGARAFLRRVGGSSSHFSTLDNLEAQHEQGVEMADLSTAIAFTVEGQTMYPNTPYNVDQTWSKIQKWTSDP